MTTQHAGYHHDYAPAGWGYERGRASGSEVGSVGPRAEKCLKDAGSDIKCISRIQRFHPEIFASISRLGC
jgi:hypothetical protein